MNDPFLHFYETFLESYDKVNKEKRGVYYTPLPVVRFIVRAVDDILKTEFNLPHGLADDTKVKYKRFVYVDTSNKRAKQPKEVWSEEEIYKVQILDPATGTGTFLAETIRKIYEYFVNQKGIWSQYVDNALIPRLNGFEIMMTPYVMCHLKLDLLLQDTGYITTKQTNRFNVYLTNALEKDETTKYPLFDWLSEEARQAGKIKSEKPIMVVMGNPPYSVSSCNKNEYIDELMEVYKQDLNERNIQPLSDDYIKFIRMGESFIEKNKEGILAYISNNSFLDGVIHRQMRKHLLETFDKIYVINLHGNAKKKECCADGSKDENVFDIQQGVSINIFIKTNSDNKESAKVYYKDLYGLRVDKYAYLDNNNMATVDYTELIPVEPYYFFVPKDFGLQEEYEKGVKVDELFLVNTSGVKTHHDNELVSLYPFDTKTNRLYSYKPFDTRYINYDLSRVVRHRYSVMKHFVLGKNIGLCLMRSLVNTELYNTVFLSHSLSDINFYGFQSYTFPLYQYNDSASEQVSFFTQNREPNLNMDIVHEFESKLGLIFTVEKETTDGTFAPIDILDYIYGVLHSNTYRTKYKEFLKIDFPRIPYPKDSDYFFKVAELGRQIREIHLFDSPVLNNLVTLFPIDGDCEVIKPEYKDGKVYINAAQYFDGVPEQAWNFYIGGYQPAQKWLKDRKRRILSYEDIIHYQKIIVALEQTNRLMQAIDEIIII